MDLPNDRDGEEPSEEDNDGQKRSEYLKGNKMSDGASTDGDFDEESGQEADSDNVDQYVRVCCSL